MLSSIPNRPLAVPLSRAFFVIDFAGVFTAAVAGAFVAKENERYHFDFVGVLGLGLISALGGGLARDVMLGHGPPLALTDIRYLLVALAGALLGLSISNPGPWLRELLRFVDAAALGLFAVAGSARALGAGLRFLPAVLLGITTAVGGGSLRDVFSGRTPRIFERGEPYALVAAVASICYVFAERAWGAGIAATTVGVVTGFALRLAAMHFAWSTSRVRKSDPNV